MARTKAEDMGEGRREGAANSHDGGRGRGLARERGWQSRKK